MAITASATVVVVAAEVAAVVPSGVAVVRCETTEEEQATNTPTSTYAKERPHLYLMFPIVLTVLDRGTTKIASVARCHDMKTPTFIYHRPETVDEALRVLADHEDAKVLAGGQSLVPLMALRLGQPDHLVDIGRLADLSYIREHEGGVAIGALARHADAEDSSLVASNAPLVAKAMRHIGHRAIRNRGTVCGSLAHADPAAELPAVALATDAMFVVRSVRGERWVPAALFFQGYLSSALEADEMLTEVRFPASAPRSGAAVVELSRRFGDYALAGVACLVALGSDGTVASCALSYFGVAATPVRVTQAESALIGRPPNAEAFTEAAAIVSEQLSPPDDAHGSSAYRKHLAGVLTRRALTEATDSARNS
jgi:aerobic carbon-monoxide dehydrogenase medium subunit